MNKNTPCGVFFIPGGGIHFYGHLHTTSGNLQGNFAIFVPKNSFAPRSSRISSSSRKKIPKQITGNLFKKLYILLIFYPFFDIMKLELSRRFYRLFLFALPDIGGAFLLQKRTNYEKVTHHHF